MIKYYLLFSILIITSCKKPKISAEKPEADQPVLAGVPKMFTDSISDLSAFSVTFTGKLIDQGSAPVTEFGFVIDTITNATITKNLNKFKSKTNNSSEFKNIVIDILPGKTFYLRSYGINAKGIGYGNEVKFITLNANVSAGPIVLNSQQDVVELGKKKYTCVQSLEISGNITDLSPLKTISSINSWLRINNTKLKDLSGLENLEAVGVIFPSGLRIENIASLTSLKGLNKLKFVNGYFYILNNNALTDLVGLDKYTSTYNGDFYIGNCDNLQSLNGIEKMSDCDGLVLTNNAHLVNLRALKNLSTIGGHGLAITENKSLSDLTGLEGLTTVSSGNPSFDTANIYLENNPLLTNLHPLSNITYSGGLVIKNSVFNNLTGLTGLKKVVGAIKIISCPKLISLAGMTNLTDMGFIDLENNNMLATIKDLKDVKTTSGIVINNNPMLSSLTGLNHIKTIETLSISGNPLLKDLTGLDSLHSVTTTGGYAITITNNASLQSLKGLEALTSSTSGISINYNSSLDDFCPLKSLFKTYEGSCLLLYNKINITPKDVLKNCQ